MTLRPALFAALLLAGCATAAAPTPNPKAAMSNATPIVQAGTPVLRQRAQEVPPAQIGSPETQALIARMIEAMRHAPVRRPPRAHCGSP